MPLETSTEGYILCLFKEHNSSEEAEVFFHVISQMKTQIDICSQAKHLLVTVTVKTFL